MNSIFWGYLMSKKVPREFGETQDREYARLRALVAEGDLRPVAEIMAEGDLRPAAEIMSDVVMPIMGPALLWDCLFEEDGWRTYGWSCAGPAASQIFDAAVMREQVDPT